MGYSPRGRKESDMTDAPEHARVHIKPWKDMEEAEMRVTKWKKPIGKGYILCDYNFVMLWKTQDSGDSERISGCQGLGVEVQMVSRAQRLFGGHETTLQETKLVDRRHYSFVQTHRLYGTKTEH